MAGAEYNAGKSVSTWDMNLAPLRASVIEAKRLYAELAAAAQQAQQAAQIPPARGTQTVVPRAEAPGALNVGSGPGVDRAAVASAKLAAEQHKAALAAQRLATEEQRTAVAAANVERAETQAASAALRLSQQQDKANTAASKGKSSFSQLAQGIQGIQGLLGAAGISLGAGALIQGGIAAGQYSVAVRQTEGVLRQLSGSQERYNELTGIAAANQRLFGGSLAENYAPLTGVLALANQTGASLSQLNGVTQLLLAKAPGKSAGDAFFGLGEFLSGKGAEAALSISDQFNLNKAAVAALAAEGVSAEQRLKGLTQLLAEQGVSSATLTARLTEQGVAYNEAGAVSDRLKLQVGDLVANGLTPAARGFTIAADAASDFITRVQAARKALEDQGAGVAQASGSYAEYTARIDRVNAAQQAANSAISAMGPTVSGIAGMFSAAQPSIHAMSEAEYEAAHAGPALADAQEAAASTTAQLTNQLDIAKIAAQQQDSALSNAAAAAYAARDAGGGLTAQARAAAAALLANGAAGAAAAEQLARSSSQVDVMTAALYRQAAAAREAAGGKAGSNVNATQAKQREWQATADLAAAQSRYTEATESSAQRVARLRGELGGLTRGTAAYVNKQIELANAEKTLAAERTRSGTSLDKLATKTASAANAEAVAQRDAMRRIESMTQDHYDKLRQMQEDYALSSSRKAEDFQIERRRLLAAGQIAEANLLEEKYNLQARRDAEDAARQRQRQDEQAAQQIADAADQAGLKASDRERKRLLGGVALAGDTGTAAIDAAGARQAQAEASMAATAGRAAGGGLLRMQFAPISLLLDGHVVAQAIYGDIEAMLDADWSEKGLTLLVTAPPGGGQGGGVGGPRP